MSEKNNEQLRRVLAHINPAQAEISYVFHSGSELSAKLESTVMKDWHSPLQHPRWMPNKHWFFQPDDGCMALLSIIGTDNLLITRDRELYDYTIEAEVRFLSWRAQETPGNGRTLQARCGLIYRFADFYRYYTLCAEAGERFVLYRRDDMLHFYELGEYRTEISQDHYYRLSVGGSGDEIVCNVDGREVIRVRDDTLRKGEAGIRNLGMAAYRSVTVTADEKQWATIVSARERESARLLEKRESYPQMELMKTIEYPVAVSPGLFGSFTGSTGLDYVCKWHDEEAATDRLGVFNAAGEMVWNK